MVVGLDEQLVLCVVGILLLFFITHDAYSRLRLLLLLFQSFLLLVGQAPLINLTVDLVVLDFELAI